MGIGKYQERLELLSNYSCRERRSSLSKGNVLVVTFYGIPHGNLIEPVLLSLKATLNTILVASLLVSLMVTVVVH